MMAKILSEAVHIVDATGKKLRITLDNDGVVRIGGSGAEGYVAIYSPNADRADLDGSPSVVLEGKSGIVWIGTKDISGKILMFPSEFDQSDPKRATIQLDAQRADLRMGGGGKAGQIFLFPSGGDQAKKRTASLHLDGEAGDIVLQKGDVAEDFDIEESDLVAPGTVVVIGEDTKLHQCRQAYDNRVAGVIAGAGESAPGMILGRQVSEQRRLPLALMGRVFCKADARFGAIELGDLLTTSPTAGHAMKAGDPARAFGTVLGKALGSLPVGQGLVPVLVALQ